MILEIQEKNSIIESHFNTNLELDCFFIDQICLIPREITQLLLNSMVFYSRTLDESGNPYIRQIIFIYEMDKCAISFLSKKDSPEEKNLNRNPLFSLNSQVGSEINLKNDFGLRIKTKAEILISREDRIKIERKLLRKYSSHLVKPEIVEKYSSDNDVVINAQIIDIYQWNGHKSINFMCKKKEKY